MKHAELSAVILGVAALLGAWPGAPSAQEATAPRLYLMGDFLVETARADEYEAGLKDLLAELKTHGFPLLFDAYSTDDGHYYFIYEMDGYAGADRWHAAWEAFAAKAGWERFLLLHGRTAACEIEGVYKFWTFTPEQSFLPDNSRLRMEEIGYYTWDYVYLLPGKEAEFEAINKEWVALSRRKGARDPFMTYRGGFGTSQPAYCWFEWGKSAADYAAAEDAFWKAMGEEGATLSKRTRALIRRTETKTGRYRPDLSYSPQK
ncbi:MAG: hypothetical protein JW742_07060 [Candidatus Aminicenantes bacterium]|nr:hypothetical protein [Candidatus Aminicenantes bacterium]